MAIARHFTLTENAAAGFVVAALVGIMSITGLITWASHATPVPVVKGIQVGAGLSLCLSAGSSLLAPLGWTGEWWGDNLIWVIFAAVLLLGTLAFPRMPYALIIFSIGIVLSTFSPIKKSSPEIPHGPAIPILHPSAKDFWHATTTASLGQLPLTLLNSVIAASALASDLLPSPPYPQAPSVTSLGLSVAMINLVGCWFGAMPACHGSGGLAGQFRFGARSGASIIMLGLAKFGLGLFSLWYQAPLLRLLHSIPKSLLGVLVLAAGIELAKVGESINTDAKDLRLGDDGKEVRELDERERKERWSVMLVTVAVLLAFRNDAAGFAAGIAWHWGLNWARKVERWSEGNFLSPPRWRFSLRRPRAENERTSLLGSVRA